MTDPKIDTDIRCECGAPTHSHIGRNTSVYTCTECGQWVATLRFETARGATLFGEPTTFSDPTVTPTPPCLVCAAPRSAHDPTTMGCPVLTKADGNVMYGPHRYTI